MVKNIPIQLVYPIDFIGQSTRIAFLGESKF